jgi:hypothetical protein
LQSSRLRIDSGSDLREPDVRRPEPPLQPAPEAVSAGAVLALQRSAGNAAVGALLARAPAATETPAARLRKLLQDDDERGAIAFMGSLDATEAGALLADAGLRALAVKAFDDGEMARAMSALPPGVRLVQKLNWMSEEGSSFRLVWPLLTDKDLPEAERTEVYDRDYLRDFFVDVCNDEEMARVVTILGGKPAQQLRWMIAEGTNARLVFSLARGIADADLFTRGVPQDIKVGLREELSGRDYQRAVQMLTRGLLTWGSVDEKHDEHHFELKDEKDPTKGYKLKDFEVHAKYAIDYSRTELRVKVGIRLHGEKPDNRHLTIWRNGIQSKWNGAFHIENGKRLAIVFEPIFNGELNHHSIELHKPPVVREDASNWYAGPNASTAAGSQDTTDGDTAAHEFGHLIGMDDEYNLTAADYTKYTGAAPPPGPAPASGYDTTSVMGTAGTGPVEGRHVRPFVDWLNRNRLPGEKPYRLVPGP